MTNRPMATTMRMSDRYDRAAWQDALGVMAVVGGLAVGFGPVLRDLAARWWTSDQDSYGVLIPVISGYLLWSRRERLRGAVGEPAVAAGLTAVVAALALLAVGQAGGALVVSSSGLVLAVAGCVLLLLGRRVLHAVALPLAYLLFMVPVWGLLTEPLHIRFQQFSAWIGISVLQAVGIPAYRDGLFIQLPHVTLEVARSCSGVNYLIAVIAIGVPLASLFLDRMWRRVALIVFAVAIATVGNGLRVTLIGVLSYLGMTAHLHGPGHVLGGLFVSAVGFGALFAGLSVLATRTRGPQTPGRLPLADSSGPPVARRAAARLDWRWVAVATLTLAGGGYLAARESAAVPLRLGLAHFPATIAGWSGADAELPDVKAYVPYRFDQELSRVYRRADSTSAGLYVGYHAAQHQGKELDLFSDHVVDLGGRERDVTIAVADGPPIEARSVTFDHRGRPRLMVYTFLLASRSTGGKYASKLMTTWLALRDGRTNGAVVAVVTDLDSPARWEDGLSRVEGLFVEAVGLTRGYAPGL